MAKSILVTREVIEDLELRAIGRHEPWQDVVHMDHRRLQREFRRVRIRQRRRGVRESAGWWVLFWKCARHYGVRA